MDNQHRQISGYRELTEADIALMNELKTEGARIGQLIAKLEANPHLDQRWVAAGTLGVQQGFMSLIRAVAQPTTFC